MDVGKLLSQDLVFLSCNLGLPLSQGVEVPGAGACQC